MKRLVLSLLIPLVLAVALLIWKSGSTTTEDRPQNETDILRPPDRMEEPEQDVLHVDRKEGVDRGLATAPGQITSNRNAAASGKIRRDRSGKDAIPNEVLLSFYDDSDKVRFIEMATGKGMRVLDSMDFCHSVRMEVKDKKSLQDLLKDGPTPTAESPNFHVRVPESSKTIPVPEDANYVGFGDASLDWLGGVRNRDNAGRGIVVAVLDTGVSPHPALSKNVIHLGLTGESAPSPGGDSDHGTAVASVIAGTSEFVPGIAPASTIMDIQVLSNSGEGDTFTLAKAIVTAVEQGARIINLSLGTSGDNAILKQAVDFALLRGVAIVASVGNDSADEVSYPAGYDGVIAVSAVDARGKHLSFANSGDKVDISAPGFAVTAAWTNDTLAGVSGTSIAAPFVSGALAFLMSANPGMSAAEAESILYKYADDAGTPGKDDQIGNGILDIRRVQERDTAGIYDVAVGDICLNKTTNNPSVLVYVQNRGTMPLNAVNLEVEIAGVSSMVSFYDIGVGETSSREFQMNTAQFAQTGSVTVSCKASIVGADDAYPENNVRKTVIQRVK